MERLIVSDGDAKTVTYYFAQEERTRPTIHYSDVIMSGIVTIVSIICPTICLEEASQRKHQSPASLAFVRESTGSRCIPITKCQ